MKKILVPLATGFEEIEAVIVIDILRRADFHVCAAGLSCDLITASRKVRVQPDTSLDKVNPDEFDALVLPGGAGGTQNLRSDARVITVIQRLNDKGRLICAVCAAPLVLHAAGILKGKKATSYPSVQKELTGVIISDAHVVVDGNIVTSQGAGTTFEFALKIVELLDSRQTAESIARSIVF